MEGEKAEEGDSVEQMSYLVRGFVILRSNLEADELVL
jgi:hypothetical protein